MWIATVLNNKDFLAISKAPLESLLLGTHPWTVYNDSLKCSGREEYTVDMTLTGCNETEFTCKDGLCVSMELSLIHI